MKIHMRAAALLGLVAGVAAAQNPPVTKQPAMQRPARQAGQAGQANNQARRAELEQQIRDRIGTALKTNLGLSDDQYGKLQATNKRFEEKRHLLVEQERDARMGLREIVISGDTTNQGKVGQGLDRLLAVQRQRMELVDQEQKELAGYLTPLQRAKYLGVQEQMFRRMEQMRAQRGGAMGPGGPPNGQPGQGMGPGMGQGMGAGGRNPQARPGLGVRRPPQGPPGELPPMGEIPPV